MATSQNPESRPSRLSDPPGQDTEKPEQPPTWTDAHWHPTDGDVGRSAIQTPVSLGPAAMSDERIGSARGALADDSEPTVTILVQDFRLSEVLRHIEAGRIVRVIPAPQHPSQAA